MHLMAKPRTGMVEVLVSHTTDLSEFHEDIGTVIERDGNLIEIEYIDLFSRALTSPNIVFSISFTVD